MKAYDLKATYDNILDTYKKDSIGRNADIFPFIEVLNSIDGGYSIALDGNWGSGKTFFVKQVKMVMDAHNSFINHNQNECIDEIVDVRNQYYKDKRCKLQPQVCVYYDAWANDNDDDPVMSLVYAIMNNVHTDFSFKNRDFIESGVSLMEMFTGVNWMPIIKSLKGRSPLDELKKHKDVESVVGEFLDDLLLEKGNRLVVFIDELDRCKPSYAVRLLERIKHYFNHEKITFVFSVNINELQHTIKKYYGNDFNGARYLERFFDLRIVLPPPDLGGYFRSLNFNEHSRYTFDIVCKAVIEKYNFELREIAKFLQIAKTVAYKYIQGEVHLSFYEGRALGFCILYIIPIMLGLRLHDTQQYIRFIGGDDYLPLVEIVEQSKICYFDNLLDSGETFNKKEDGKTLVTLDEKLKNIYNAIFSTDINGQGNIITMGDMTFSSALKDDLIRIIGMLSPFAEVNKG